MEDNLINAENARNVKIYTHRPNLSEKMFVKDRLGVFVSETVS